MVRHTVIDIYIETAFGMKRHMTIADIDIPNALFVADREHAVLTAMGEVDFSMRDLSKGRIVRVFDTFTMDYTDFE